jgi:mitochondrial fission process protein 1
MRCMRESTYHPSYSSYLSIPTVLSITPFPTQELNTNADVPRTEDTTDTSIRYAAYASRIRTIMLSAHRYVAYTSDIGESFRPIAHPYLIKGAYGVSWLYLTGDVAHEGYKAYMRNQKTLHPELHTEADTKSEGEKSSKMAGAVQKMSEGLGVKPGAGNPLTGGEVVPGRVSAIEDYRTVMAQRAVFQGLASMGLPAFTIHSIVRYSGRALKDAKNKTLRTWGPIGVRIPIPFYCTASGVELKLSGVEC